MVSARLYIEGGESKEDQIRCREGFRKLLQKAGFVGKLPRLTASGGRNAAFDDFKTAHTKAGQDDYVAMLIDSEDPLADVEATAIMTFSSIVAQWRLAVFSNSDTRMPFRNDPLEQHQRSNDLCLRRFYLLLNP